ncbi:E3 ubiquitin-protein ligase ZFP91 [Bagarius yarrelli]|uniref:E3 ubiquitin-protein ligase ZFP91 n=1 Tax=Bagarius yarrelli TaxID=175774 RepID=A0A556V7L0_BAGYA|nr:E3 ubiquitin-protein ligase ZFP91 [Bagarius yarrelli]
MTSNKEAQRRQRRRELDARRSKLRVRLGSWPESWSELKDQLGFTLHSELAQFLLNRKNVISVTVASLDQLILLIHCHSQQCPLTPSLQPDPDRQEVKKIPLEPDPETSTRSSEEAKLLRFVCEGGHMLTWCPTRTETDDNGEQSKQGSGAPLGLRRIGDRQRKGVKQEEVCRMRSRRRARGQGLTDGLTAESSSSVGNKETECLCNSDAVQREQDAGSQEGSDASLVPSPPDISVEPEADDAPNITDEIRSSVGRKPTTPKLILPCEFDGCWKIFSSRQYLNVSIIYHSVMDWCEVCGFTCRQKASLNWHMRKHDAERNYRFACEICGRRFEKRDNVTAHRSKCHDDHATSDLPEKPTANDLSPT